MDEFESDGLSLEPNPSVSKEMLDAGERVAFSFIDSDWNSVPLDVGRAILTRIFLAMDESRRAKCGP